nr:MAG TPA: hypothetical protein [Caudoviricetes sp.]
MTCKISFASAICSCVVSSLFMMFSSALFLLFP